MSSLNIIKKYPELLELAYLSEREREHDLHAIFKRDIEDNCQFSFRGWRIYPIKTDGEIDMARLFKHLTCEEIMVENEDGTTYPKRVFEMARSQRLHWINHHVRELTPDNLDVFTIEERDGKKRKVKKTYIYYNPQIQISAESETKRSIFREKDKTKRSKKESAQHSKSRNKSFVMTSVSAL